MRNYFTFAGKDCRDFDLYINGHKTFNSPERRYSLYDVPGRSGSIAEDGKSFDNLELTYENSFIFQDFDRNFSNLKNYLLSQSGYQRLVDTYHPDEFRKAIFRKVIEPTMNESNEVGAFDLVFECQPQRFLLSGETNQVFSSNGTITNPTRFASSPIIYVNGPTSGITGTIQLTGVNGSYTNTITITSATSMLGEIVVDSEIMDCYVNTSTRANKNSNFSFSNYEFPVLHPGDTSITISGNITQIKVKPRWFRI